MHMAPGVPIMKSKDLVDWELIGYAYDRLTESDRMNLEGGVGAYSRGTWASSIRHHNGVFYVSTFSQTTGKTHVYTTRDIESGDWEEQTFEPAFHDHSLFFDDDGRTYLIYGVGDIRIRELEADASGVKPGGIDRVLIEGVGRVSGGPDQPWGEGSQVIKANGWYFVMNITWPRGGMRTQIVHRARSLEGPWEGRVVLQDKGVAQGCLIDTPDGRWFAVLFRDFGSVGRIPYLVPVTWEDGWPVLGVEGKAPMTLDIPDLRPEPSGISRITASDEFDRMPGDRPLPLAWQWNHQPDDRFWSLRRSPGWLRLENGRVVEHIERARNTLTQRTFGPTSHAEVKLDVHGLKDGDHAGLTVFAADYGWVGVVQEGSERFLVMTKAVDRRPVEVARVPLEASQVVLRADCDFGEDRRDLARFYYSLNGIDWTPIGEELRMRYTLVHFMGYRFGLFSYATRQTGGAALFDYFRIGPDLLGKK